MMMFIFGNTSLSSFPLLTFRLTNLFKMQAGTGIKELKCCYLNRLGTTVTNHRSMFVQITNVVSGAHVEIPNTSPQQGNGMWKNWNS